MLVFAVDILIISLGRWRVVGTLVSKRCLRDTHTLLNINYLLYYNIKCDMAANKTQTQTASLARMLRTRGQTHRKRRQTAKGTRSRFVSAPKT